MAGTGHGYSGRGYYGRGYYGGSYYGGGYYGRGYYGRGYYPYYRSYYPYYGGSWWPGFSFGLGLYYGSGYGYLGAGYGPFYGYATSPVGSSYTVYDAPYDPVAYASDSSAGYGSGEPPPLRLDTRLEDGREPAPGELRLVVRPHDASVYVDDRFLGSARQLETLSLAPGPHRIEVVRPGFRTAERTVQVRADGPATVVIEMEQR